MRQESGSGRGCVCGHTRGEHEAVVLSVPLVGKDLYPEPASLMPVIDKRAQRPASYDSVQCHCGCASWLPDDDRTGYVHLARTNG